MKPMSLLVCGIVVSSLAAGAPAQQRPRDLNWQPGQPAGLHAWQQEDARNREFTPPAPRGDLRGDIASNARARPEPPRAEGQRRR